MEESVPEVENGGASTVSPRKCQDQMSPSKSSRMICIRSFLSRVQKVVLTCFPLLITIVMSDCPIRQIVASDPRHQITFMANWRAHTGGHIWRTFVTHLEHIANEFLTHWSTKTLIAHLCNIYPAHFMLILLN